MTRVLPCITIVGSSVDVDEPTAVVEELGAKVIGLSNEVCVPVVSCAIII
jgi:hypothetical protein